MGREPEEAWRERAAGFTAIAEAYERARPGYPDQLYSDVLSLAPAAPRVLEVGAGTGKATVGLARRGATVVATEPDPGMAAVARRVTARLPVEVVLGRFEDHPVAAGSFDVVAAAQSWHWVEHTGGAAVAAAALRPGGVLAAWWNRPGDLAGPVWEAIRAVQTRHAPDPPGPGAGRAGPRGERGGRAVPGFSPWTRCVHDWSLDYDAASYAALVACHPDHHLLPQEQRSALLAGITRAVEEVGGGHVRHNWRTLLLTARRLDG